MSPKTGVSGLNSIQAANASAIVRVGQQLGYPDKALVIAIATALQESDLGADPTSSKPNRDGDAGVFQQRCKPGWYGTLAQVNDINYAATVFYNGKKLTKQDVQGVASPAGPAGYTIPGLAQIKGWELLSVAAAAQAVQRSAFPMAYAKHETRAKQIVAELKSGAMSSAPNLPTSSTDNSTSLFGLTLPAINWKSIAFIVLGLALVIIALYKITGVDDIVMAGVDTAATIYTKGLVNVK